MSPTKVKELTPITEAKHDDSRCRICHPRRDYVYEDQLWGRCATNTKHPPHGHHQSAKERGR